MKIDFLFGVICKTVRTLSFYMVLQHQIGPYSLTRVKITPKVLIISYLFVNYYDQIVMCVWKTINEIARVI